MPRCRRETGHRSDRRVDRADIGVINQNDDSIYRYVNFDRVEEYADVAKTAST